VRPGAIHLSPNASSTGMSAMRLSRTVKIGDVQNPMRQERIASVHRVVSALIVCLASVQISAQPLTNVEAVVLPLPAELRVDGLLGVNVLEHFRTTFAFPQATIMLR
jgi:hypothetical protein